MSQSHHKTLAKSLKELHVKGDYMEICVERIILDATVRLDLSRDELKKCVLIEAIYSNLWEHCIGVCNQEVLVDSNGFQHSAYSSRYKSTVCKSKQLEEGTELSELCCEVEGNAKVRGWIAFPGLEKSVVPYRLISRVEASHPNGEDRHSETLELIFDLSLYNHLLENNRKHKVV